LEEFEKFQQILRREYYLDMANFSYGDAKHLPELKEVSKDSTKIQDFIAAVTAYHVELTAEGQTKMIAFVKKR
jgi:hypothetical protein